MPTTYPSLVGLTKAVHMCVCVCLCVHARDNSNCVSFPHPQCYLLYMYSTFGESAHPRFYSLYQHGIHYMCICCPTQPKTYVIVTSSENFDLVTLLLADLCPGASPYASECFGTT